MDFSLSDEQQMVIKEAKRFAEKRLAPKVEELDEKGEVNITALKELGELGYLGITVPEKYGGVNMGAIAYAGTMLELSKVDAGTAVEVSVHNSLVNEGILKFGTEKQKQEYLPKLATGEWLGCFSLSEANAGSDPGALRMSAVRKGGNYVLNGTKNFTSSGDFADVIFVFAQTDMDKTTTGISAFILTKDTPGFSVGKHENKMGIRSASCTELVFEDCVIPVDSMLGKENKGLRIALTLLDGGRIGIAAQAIGIAEAALEEAIRYSKERVQFKRTLSKFQGIQFMLAEMATEVELAKTMLFRVAWMKDSGVKDYVKESAMLKLYASEMSHRVCHKSLQIHGGYGYMKDYKIERLYRDQRITEIYEGTSEIQKVVIARKILE
ncbi:acyl-CoA dehydrogenase family protein [candidate division KSB1 bacterium]|nr:acyl-CoA dehydrogenase family protein [candidate division KSB1 bacterium]MBL7094439.1 acyl-CoA dehydrogenase family protein [candidate division KSB1 bacterium]